MREPRIVMVQEDIETVVGIIASGTRFLAVPDIAGTTWTLELSLPRGGVGSRPLVVPASKVKLGSELPEVLERKLAARLDYRFARTMLRHDHDTAMQWLSRGYKVTHRTLERWGFTQHELGVAS